MAFEKNAERTSQTGQQIQNITTRGEKYTPK
jgi:hypothetical protein